MTQEQVLQLQHLKTAEVKPNMFVHIHAEDGYVITSWNDDDDIKNYSGSVCMYMPILNEYPETYRTIPVEQHNDLEARQREIFEAEQKARLNEQQ